MTVATEPYPPRTAKAPITLTSSQPNRPIPSPQRRRSVAKALKLFSVAAWVTGVWLLILTTRMILEYLVGIDMPQWTRIIGQLHGLFYMLYLIATMNLGVKARWKPVKWILTALAGTIPFLSFVAEAIRRKEVTAAFHLGEETGATPGATQGTQGTIATGA